MCVYVFNRFHPYMDLYVKTVVYIITTSRTRAVKFYYCVLWHQITQGQFVFILPNGCWVTVTDCFAGHVVFFVDFHRSTFFVPSHKFQFVLGLSCAITGFSLVYNFLQVVITLQYYLEKAKLLFVSTSKTCGSSFLGTNTQ